MSSEINIKTSGLICDRSNWKTVRLGEVGEFFKGHGVTMKDTSLSGIPCTMYGDIYVKYGITFDKVDYYLPPEKAAKALKAKRGDLLFTASGETAEEIGKCAGYLGNNEICVGGDIIVLRPSPDYDSLFLSYLCNSPKCIHQKSTMGQGDAVVHIKSENLQNIRLAVPMALGEQKNIASFLFSIDSQISATRRLLAKYESLKKATVKLLMTPGDNWHVVMLGNLCDDYGYGVSASAKHYDGVNKYIRITDIDDSSHLFVPSPLASPAFFSSKHMVHLDDILFARTGASVGKSYLYNSEDGNLIYAGFLIKMHINPSKADSNFIFQYTTTSAYMQWVSTESMRTGQPGLNLEQYMTLKLPVPSLDTQHEISKQITTYDKTINTCKRELHKLITVKQSMLQYFFG